MFTVKEFQPSANVKQGHALAGTSFDVLVKDPNTYGMRAGGIVILLLGLGIISQFFLAWGLIFRCCCKSCKCLPKNLDQKSHEERMLLLKNRQFYWNISFFGICLAVIIVDCIIFLGSASFQKGIMAITDGLGAVADFVGTFSKALKLISSATTNWKNAAEMAASICLYNGVTSANFVNSVNGDITTLGLWTTLRADDANCAGGTTACNTAITQVETIIANMLPSVFEGQVSSVGSISSITSSLSGFLDTIVDVIKSAQDSVSLYAYNYKDLLIYILFALALVCIILFLLFRLCKFTCGLQTTMFFSFFILFLICILNAFWLSFTIVTADFCMNPAGNILNAVGNSTSTGQTLSFYFYNQGESRIQKDLSSIQDSFKQATDLLDELNGYRIPNDIWDDTGSTTCGLSTTNTLPSSTTDSNGDGGCDNVVDYFSVTQCVGSTATPASSCGGNTTPRDYAFVRTSQDTTTPDETYGYWGSCTPTAVSGGTCTADGPHVGCATPGACRGTLDSIAAVALCGNPATNPYNSAGVTYTYKDFDYSHGSYYAKVIKTSSVEIGTAIQMIYDNVGFQALHNILHIFIQDAICTQFYDGVYYVWISQTVTGLLLWFAILITSYVYHYFPSSFLMKIYAEGGPDDGTPLYAVEEGNHVPGTYLADGTFIADNNQKVFVNDYDNDPEYNYVDQDNTNTDNYFDDTTIKDEIDRFES